MRTLDEIIPADAPQGAGVLCECEDGRYLFALYDESRAGGRRLICGRIGGTRHPGEPWEHCVRREVMEEADCECVVISADQCFYADLEGRAAPIAVVADPRPILISRQPLAPRISNPRADLESAPGVYYNVLFRARLVGEPRPGVELDALVVLDRALLLSIARGSPTLRQLEGAGARVTAARELNPDAPVILGRSAELLLDLLPESPA